MRCCDEVGRHNAIEISPAKPEDAARVKLLLEWLNAGFPRGVVRRGPFGIPTVFLEKSQKLAPDGCVVEPTLGQLFAPCLNLLRLWRVREVPEKPGVIGRGEPLSTGRDETDKGHVPGGKGPVVLFDCRDIVSEPL
jgi:hypothetical protein